LKESQNPVEYLIRLSPDDRYRHTHTKRGGRIIRFRIQLETRINKIWYPVVRYDTAHGFAHRDLLDKYGDAMKTPLFNQNYNDALTFAEHDLKINWEHYKEKFLEDFYEK